jgi:hypothetical protein
MQNFAAQLRETANAVADLGLQFESFADQALLDAQQVLAAHRRAVDVVSAALAGEIGRRSARERGYEGLAQKAGFLSAEALIQSVTGSGRAEVAKHVAVGSALQSTVDATVLEGTISVDAADAIQRGLGTTDDTALALIDGANTVDADRLYRRARELRDELDADAIARREKEQRDLRTFSYSRRGDGMVRGSFLLDPLDGALVTAAFDAVLSPRRGGPRFSADEQKQQDALLESDPRTTKQIAADSFVDMIALAVDADAGAIFGSRRPAVRVVVTADALRTRVGAGQLEDHGEPVSIETVDRMICDAGVIGIAFDDDGQCINVGRTQRLFTARQRIGLAVRDGGCRFPSCDRPVSMTEAHHIDHWHRDGGKTDLADGILLCRRHHLLVHNNHWHITRTRAQYWLAPPPDVDPAQTRLVMPPKTRVLEKRAG